LNSEVTPSKLMIKGVDIIGDQQQVNQLTKKAESKCK